MGAGCDCGCARDVHASIAISMQTSIENRKLVIRESCPKMQRAPYYQFTDDRWFPRCAFICGQATADNRHSYNGLDEIDHRE
jgi:hypothetical protein